MFEDSLVESSGRLKSKRGWTTIVSFSVQIGIVIVMILVPLIYTEALPTKQLLTFLVAPPPPPPPPPPPAAAVVIKRVPTEIVDNVLRTPTKIPQKIAKIVEDEAPAPSMGGVAGGISGGVPGGVLGSVLSAANTPPPKVAMQRVRVSSGVVAGNLLTKVTPVYPPIAKQAHISGQVVLQAMISKQGTIEHLTVISGHPMLTQSAIDAVSKWRYKPYILNGEPVEVDTTVTVNFSIGG